LIAKLDNRGTTKGAKVDDLDSGERRAQKLEVQFAEIIGEFKALPDKIKLACMEAVATQKAVCDAERNTGAKHQNSWSSPQIKWMAGVIVTLLAIIGALVGTGFTV
jgi:hypothetical protein